MMGLSLATWVSIVLALLKMAQAIFGWVQGNKDYDRGRDAEIAAVTAAILLKTNTANKVLQEVMSLSDDQVDKALKDLAP